MALYLDIVFCIEAVVEVKHMLILGIDMRLIEDAQDFVQTIANLPVKAGYLHNDAVVSQTVDKGIRYALGDELLIVVVCLMADIDDRLLYITDTMAQQIDGHHRQGMTALAVGDDVPGILILHAQILAEPQRLGGQLGLLFPLLLLHSTSILKSY